MIRQPFRTALLALLLTSAGSAVAGDSYLDKMVDYREHLMDVYAFQMKSIGMMLKGELPYDAAQVAARANDLAAATQIDLLAAFPEASEGHADSDARPDIWLDFAAFSEKFQRLQQHSAALAKVAAGGDQEAIATAFKQVGGSCKSCHKAYKQ